MSKRIAIIGFGNIAQKHIEVFQALGCDIVASCNRSEENRSKAKEAGIQHVYSDHVLLAKEIKPDGILVSVSFWQMYSVIKDLLPFGIPLLVEKPTGTSLSEHEELIALATQYKTPVMVGLNRRYYSVFQKSIADLGGINKVKSLSIEWSENPSHLINNRKLTHDQLMKYVFGNTIHGLDMISLLSGGFEHYHTSINSSKPYDWVYQLSGTSKMGAIVHFSCAWAYGVPWRVVIGGEGVRYVFAPLEKCLKYVDGVKEPTELLPDAEDLQFKAGFMRQAQLFMDLIDSRALTHPNDLESVTASMQLGQGIYELL